MWLSGLILAMTLTLDLQGQIFRIAVSREWLGGLISNEKEVNHRLTSAATYIGSPVCEVGEELYPLGSCWLGTWNSQLEQYMPTNGASWDRTRQMSTRLWRLEHWKPDHARFPGRKAKNVISDNSSFNASTCTKCRYLKLTMTIVKLYLPCGVFFIAHPDCRGLVYLRPNCFTALNNAHGLLSGYTDWYRIPDNEVIPIKVDLTSVQW